MDITRLRTLRELARCRTMAAAAESLHLTPSAVSQQVAQLEGAHQVQPQRKEQQGQHEHHARLLQTRPRVHDRQRDVARRLAPGAPVVVGKKEQRDPPPVERRGLVDALTAEGVSAIEVKSGYGLDIETELKMLRVARRLGELRPVRVLTTLLGAHALPPEYAGRADDYVSLVCDEMIPAAAAEGLADAVDVFCENIAFSPAQCERVFQAAQRHGLPIKVHAEQLSNQGASALAARYQGLSADHIEFLDEAGVQAMAAAGTVATLLPGAFYTLRETQLPPIALLRQYNVPMALASDANPGTSPICFPTLTLNQACTLFRLTPREALAGMTAHAARAIGRPDLGRITVGAPADLCLWDVQQPAELAYAVQPGRLRQRVFKGVISHSQEANSHAR